MSDILNIWTIAQIPHGLAFLTRFPCSKLQIFHMSSHVPFLGVNSFPGSAPWFAVGAQNSIEKRRFFGANSDAMFLRPKFKAMPWQRRKEATAAALRQASCFCFSFWTWKNTKQHEATLPGMARGSNLRIFCLFFQGSISAYISIFQYIILEGF